MDLGGRSSATPKLITTKHTKNTKYFNRKERKETL